MTQGATMTVYEPDDVPDWTQGRLRGHEETWLERRRSEVDQTDDRPPRSLSGRVQKAVDRWSVDAGWVARGLAAATATIPPPAREVQERRTNVASDPTGAVVFSTVDTVLTSAAAWAHLAGPCPYDGVRLIRGVPDERGMVHECPAKHAVALFDYIGLELDPTPAIDGLLGTPPSARDSFGKAVSAAARWHSTTAATLVGAWSDVYRLGAETSVLETIVTDTEDLANRMAGLAGSLTAWSGRQEDRCVSCGGMKPDQRTECGACRTRKWRTNRGA